MSYPRIAPATAPTATATPAQIVGDRGPLEFAPGERVAAFVVGALIWFALAVLGSGEGGESASVFAPLLGGAGEGWLADPVHCGDSGPMAFSASLGAAFLLREWRRVQVRGLERVACITLSLPLLQISAVASLSFSYNRLGLSPVAAGVIGAVGSVLLVAASLTSLGGGIAAVWGAGTNRAERLAAIAIPVLWLWQWYCFLPWSARWLASP